MATQKKRIYNKKNKKKTTSFQVKSRRSRRYILIGPIRPLQNLTVVVFVMSCFCACSIIAEPTISKKNKTETCAFDSA